MRRPGPIAWCALVALLMCVPMAAAAQQTRGSADTTVAASVGSERYRGADDDPGWALVRFGVGPGAAQSLVRLDPDPDGLDADTDIRGTGHGCCAMALTAAAGRGPVGVHASLYGYLLPATTDDGSPASIDEGRPGVIGFGVGATAWLVPERVWLSPSVQIPWLATFAVVAALAADDDEDDGFADPEDLDAGGLRAQVGVDFTVGFDQPVTDHVYVGVAVGVGGFHLALPAESLPRSRSGVSAHSMLTLTLR